MADDEKALGDQVEKTEIQKLLDRVVEVSKIINTDSNQLSDDDRKDLEVLADVLDKEIKPKLIAAKGPGDVKKDEEEAFLPYAESKREELSSLLGEIERALRPRIKQPESELAEVQRKKMLSLGCSPFKLLQRSRQQGGGGQEGEDEALSPKLLVRLARHVLEPEQYYEWTTSYVDESRIFGWDEDADKVANALVGPDEGDFRAAAITGIHGSGKTALAQKVFIHDKAKDHFPIRLWVCVGPPHKEDRFNLLYRMLDNLGHDTNWIEDEVVDNAQVVMKQREALFSEQELEDLRKKAADMVAAKHKGERELEDLRKKAADMVAAKHKGEQELEDLRKKPPQSQKEEEEKKRKQQLQEEEGEKKRIYKQLLKEKVGDDRERYTPGGVVDSKTGVLLYILHATLAKTGYLIVFDDIRVYRDDGWYSNLTLPPPPPDKEWHDRLAYGLPKTGKHRSAVLVTCRKEDDAKTMVRTGRVFRPPKLETDNGWKLFEREYKQAKEGCAKTKQDNVNVGGKKDDEDLLFKGLAEMKKEIVNKCLGLPVAIIEAAKGYACSDLKPLPSPAASNKEDMPAGKAAKKDADADIIKPAQEQDREPADQVAE